MALMTLFMLRVIVRVERPAPDSCADGGPARATGGDWGKD
ncbi:hypothetical protein L083_1932 [Actinoplanes sp. N902-109]|nr:hypothetical protein L083_1932 [Actinoplanes sp. N902-109]